MKYTLRCWIDNVGGECAVVDGIYDVVLTYCSFNVPSRLLAFDDDILSLDGPIKSKPIPAIADVNDLFSIRLTLPVSRCCRNS